MRRDWYEAAEVELVQSAAIIYAMVLKEDDISVGRTSKWSPSVRRVSGEEEAGILGKGDK